MKMIYLNVSYSITNGIVFRTKHVIQYVHIDFFESFNFWFTYMSRRSRSCQLLSLTYSFIFFSHQNALFLTHLFAGFFSSIINGLEKSTFFDGIDFGMAFRRRRMRGRHRWFDVWQSKNKKFDGKIKVSFSQVTTPIIHGLLTPTVYWNVDSWSHADFRSTCDSPKTNLSSKSDRFS